MKRAMFVGRWQPCHKGHEWLIRQQLDQGMPCLVVVRHIPPDNQNPYTTEQTCEMLQLAFKGEDVLVHALPCDISGIYWGRGVGYELYEYPAAPVWVSGTEIRTRLAAGEPIDMDLVSPAVVEYLRATL